MLQTGTKAPAITLLDQNGATFRLSEALGKKVIVLFFYPKDDSFGCTAEACAFRDAYQEFTDIGAEVIGISNDSVASHQKFAGNNRLPYTLLSDPDRVAEKAYDVERSLFGILKGRITYVIGLDGIIHEAFNSALDFNGHVRKALQRVRSLQTV